MHSSPMISLTFDFSFVLENSLEASEGENEHEAVFIGVSEIPGVVGCVVQALRSGSPSESCFLG